MENILKKLNDAAILFLYYLKWPYFIGYALLYNYGLNDYLLLDIVWFLCGFLIAKDLYAQYKKEQAQKEDSKE
ncbi:MAG: hypothetical protein H8E76_06115 [Helicobacteraceae bacterium]|nr:hypothetical protein [Candidatus Sulfurimonas ponti]MBL6972896.1 hypothetical protein [Sulfurimonas sp.]